LYRIQLISNIAGFQKKGACIDIHWFNIIDKKNDANSLLLYKLWKSWKIKFI